jgi:hypothetical protein
MQLCHCGGWTVAGWGILVRVLLSFDLLCYASYGRPSVAITLCSACPPGTNFHPLYLLQPIQLLFSDTLMALLRDHYHYGVPTLPGPWCCYTSAILLPHLLFRLHLGKTQREEGGRRGSWLRAYRYPNTCCPSHGSFCPCSLARRCIPSRGLAATCCRVLCARLRALPFHCADCQHPASCGAGCLLLFGLPTAGPSTATTCCRFMPAVSPFLRLHIPLPPLSL